MESAELIEILREVRERVRARHPQGTVPGDILLPDLLPLVHARDAALGKVASIGTVNPRGRGLLNKLVQAWKRFVARVLDWHVREQVVFNRKVVDSMDATIETLDENNRALSELAGRMAAAQEQALELRAAQQHIDEGLRNFREDLQKAHQRLSDELRTSLRELGEEFNDIRKHWAEWRQGWEQKLATNESLRPEFNDIRKHWAEWRQGWEHKLAVNEIQFLRSVADLQGTFQHRVTLMDTSYRESGRTQHAEFTQALEKAAERIRMEAERLIHSELRLLRQRLEPRPVEPAPAFLPPIGAAETHLAFDYGRFAERFRGSEEYVKAAQQVYLADFRGRKNVLDIGSGRGEFLETMQTAGVEARGIDLSPESVALCRQKGLNAEVADLFTYLAGQPEGTFDGIFCSQVVEHLPPERLPEMIKLAASRLARDGVLVIETPNPECLAIFATHFYLDPTHTRPVPHPLLMFYMEEFGVGGLQVRLLSPAVETMGSLAGLPAEFREAFFGGLDYAVIGKKL